MFSRRHPYLFFLLIFSGICLSFLMVISLIGLLSLRSIGFDVLETSGQNRIGIVEISGYLTDAADSVKAIKRFREDASIRAVVLRIDSPGGAVGPAQEIYREVVKTVGVKPVIASMGTVAASGGYYIASPATRIVANPGTLTGSIGVIMNFANVEELIHKFGLVPVVIKSGEHKDIGSPMRKMKPEERAILQELSDQVHRQFITAVADGRKLPENEVRKLADGRVFSGETAKEKGLVDMLGNFEDAVDLAASTAGIEGKVEEVHAEDKKVKWLKKIAETAVSAALDAGWKPVLQY